LATFPFLSSFDQVRFTSTDPASAALAALPVLGTVALGRESRGLTQLAQQRLLHRRQAATRLQQEGDRQSPNA